MYKVRIITGQTGTGKTRFAINLAKRTHSDVLHADARQVYKKLTIVTGKDTGKSKYYVTDHISLENNRIAEIGYYTIDGIRVWGYDLIDPRTQFSSYDYKLVANYILRNAIAADTTPIIVGGTHLYLKHLTQEFTIPVGPEWELRNSLEGLSVADLQSRLVALDQTILPLMNNSDAHNPRRLMRKIEIASQKSNETPPPDKTLPTIQLDIVEKIGIKFASTEECRNTLKKRVEARLEQGALNEVTQLLKEGYTLNDPGLQTIGYTQLAAHLDGLLTLEEAIEAWLTAEIKYAKRQLSFMKQDKDIAWQYAIL